MGFQLQGKVYAVFDVEQKSDRFSKREFVLETQDRYPQVILLQASGNRIDQLDGLQVGDEVKVEFSVRGREWRSPKGEIRFFNSLDVWKVERVGAQQQLGGARGASSSKSSTQNPEDDIPF